jgi:hypothetical protein
MTNGIDYIHLETHNWGKTVKFWQAMGFELELDLGTSGRVVHPDGGASIFIEEVGPDRAPEMRLHLDASEKGTPASPVEVSKDWHPSHWGTELLETKDVDGRVVMVQWKGEEGQ